ncbi:hypothetical protein Tco_0339953, partial [Tanacetum coccineum]
AIVKLVKKVKKLEDILKRRHVVLTDSEILISFHSSGSTNSFTWNEEAARAFSRVLMHTKSLSQVLSEVVLVLRVKPTAQRLRSNRSHKDNYRKIPGFYSNKSSGSLQSPPFK